jgi:YbbR domain-containing protein
MRLIQIYKKLIKFFQKEFNRNLFVFSIFLVIATMFWFINALSKNYKIKLPFEIQYVNIPKAKALVKELPKNITIEVEAKGFSLLTYYVRSHPIITIDVQKYWDSNSKKRIVTDVTNLKVNEEKLNSFFILSKETPEILNELKIGMRSISINPDTIQFIFANVSQKKVAVKPNVQIKFAQQFQLQNNVFVTPDSIIIYGAQEILNKIDSIMTEPIYKNDVSESFNQKIAFHTIPTITYSDSVGVTNIQVEKYTEQQFWVSLIPINVPDSLIIDLMQDKVQITTFIGMSKLKSFKTSDYKVVADYSKLNKETGEMPIMVSQKPGYAKIIKISPENIGYIINSK